MTQFPLDKCPKPTLLIEFLQGKLEPPTLDDCEAHLEQCTQCHETLRGLDSEDTLSEKVAAALIADHPRQESDSQQIDGLIKQLTSSEFQTRNPAAVEVANSEIMADRAAEVLRCVEPDEDTLGVLGDYALLRLIGSGSTGVVFQALDRTLERTVALKVLRPSLGVVARDRFLAEARSAASIEHANVVTIFQVGQVDRLAFIAMQWLPGQTLEAKLGSGVSLDESQVTDTVLKVASGLAAAHQRQLVHRDIKPANLWICDEDEQIKILDFGLARINDDNPGLTATGMLAGTPNFMSPEQARGMELDGRSDLFSLGCLMYQLLTGRLPFGASTILGTLQSVQNESPMPPRQIKPDVPQHLSDLTMCLLEKQPANRPESAHQLIEMLSLPREDWPITVNQYLGSPEEKLEVAHAVSNKTKQRSSGMRWLMAGLLLGLAGWGAWLWSPQIIRVMTDQGEVVIESKADDVEIQVFADGELIRVVDTQTQQSFDLKSGKYTFAARSLVDGKNTFAISPNQLTMSRGSTQIVTVNTVDHTTEVTPQNTEDLAAERMQFKSYPVFTDPDVAYEVMQTMLDGTDVNMSQDPVTGAIILRGREQHHKLAEETIATLKGESSTTKVVKLENSSASEILSAVQSLINQPTGRGKAENTKLPQLLANTKQNYIAIRGTPAQIFETTETIRLLDQAQRLEGMDLLQDNTAVKELLGGNTAVNEERSKSVPAQSPPPNNDKPVFKNQTFKQWWRIALHDRDAATRSGALAACAATAETEAEKESLIPLTRKICRQYGGNIIGGDSEKDLYYVAMVRVLNSLDPEQIINFIEIEIAEGTEPSRLFCHAWLVRLNLGVASKTKTWQSKLKSVQEMAGPLEDALASHIEKPGNVLVLESLLYTTNKEDFKGSALAKTLKQLAANPDQRLLLHKSIVVLLGDDLEMFQLLREDLLNPKTDPITRNKFFYAMLYPGYEERPLPRQWLQLLLDVGNGVLRQGDQKLEFANVNHGQQWGGGGFGGGGGALPPAKITTQATLEDILLALYKLEPQLEAEFKTETMLPRLKDLRKMVEQVVNAKTLLAEFDYMIKKTSGDADAKMPEDGPLKRRTSPNAGGMF